MSNAGKKVKWTYGSESGTGILLLDEFIDGRLKMVVKRDDGNGWLSNGITDLMPGISACYNIDSYELLNPLSERIMSKITDIFRSLTLTKENKLRLELNLENPTGVPTADGLELLNQILWKKHASEIDTAAAAIKAEIDSQEKK